MAWQRGSNQQPHYDTRRRKPPLFSRGTRQGLLHSPNAERFGDNEQARRKWLLGQASGLLGGRFDRSRRARGY